MLVEMKVASLTLDPLTNMPILLLKDLEDRLTLPVWIGLVEASAVATRLQDVNLSRPLTHDLLHSLLRELGAEVMHVEIVDLRNNTYYANLVVKHGSRVLELDARPSDAIALALRAGCSIYVQDHVVEKASSFDLRVDGAGTPAQGEDLQDLLGALPEEYFGKWKM